MTSQKANSVFDHVPAGLSPVARAQALLLAAASIGFTYDTTEQAAGRLLDEIKELQDTPNRDEAGDVIHAALSLLITQTPHEDFEAALIHANAKFERRFRIAEREARDDPPQNLKHWLKHWRFAKDEIAREQAMTKTPKEDFNKREDDDMPLLLRPVVFGMVAIMAAWEVVQKHGPAIVLLPAALAFGWSDAQDEKPADPRP